MWLVSIQRDVMGYLYHNDKREFIWAYIVILRLWKLPLFESIFSKGVYWKYELYGNHT